MTDTESEPRFSQWCILELMGHRRLAGLVTEQEIAGHGFLRLDVPGDLADVHATGALWTATQFYSPSSVYCMTPTTEANARRIAAYNKPEPATKWELERADREPGRDVEVGFGDDDDDDDVN